MLIEDPLFRVEIDRDSTSPNPQIGIWRGQHQCVIEGFAFDDPAPSSEKAGQIIVKHQLEGDRGHYSVLNKAFIKLDCAGFPHSVIAQITRHQDSHFLVQSGRYTGDRFIKVVTGELLINEVFYIRPEEKLVSRNGFYNRTHEQNQKRRDLIMKACQLYAEEIDAGVPYEDARGIIPYDHRQNFTISGTLEAVFHWLDQRTKADSQLEIQTLAYICFQRIKEWSPEIAHWYEKNRYGKAKLAP